MEKSGEASISIALPTEAAAPAAGGATGLAAEKPAGRHIGSLDGLRTLAVAGVLGIHAGMPGLGFGWIGVDLFFVVSGFLITTLLVSEERRTGTVSLPRFWARRFLRLMPAYWLYAAFLSVSIFGIHWGWTAEQGGWTPRGLVASIWLYYVNYAPKGGIWEHQSLMLHLWTLAVEEQFYFLWPVACLLLFRLRAGAAECVGWILALAILVRLQFAHEVFVHLDTRGIGIVLGCALALTFARRGDRARWLGRPGVRLALVVGIVAACLAASAVPGAEDANQGWLVRRVVPPLDLAFGLLVASLWFGGPDRISRFLSWRPLAYLGRISYGIYLYHMVAHHLTWHVFLRGIDHWHRLPKYGCRVAMYFGLSVAFAVISYHGLEKPFLKLKSRYR